MQDGDLTVVDLGSDQAQTPTPVNPQDENYLTAAYFAASLLSTGPGNSFLEALKAYKAKKDDSQGNGRKTTSDFLDQLMTQLDSEKFKIGLSKPDTYTFAEQAKGGDADVFVLLPAEEGMFYTYNLFAALECVYTAQLRKTKDAKMGSSEFINTSVNSLGPIFSKGEEKLKARVKIAVTKKVVSAKKEKLDGLLEVIRVNFLPNFRPQNSVQATLHESASALVQELFDYCAEKEDDTVSRGRPDKRVKIYDIMKTYFMARTPEEFVAVFKQIQEGIQVSRAEGENKAKSRGAEFALVAFRDELFRAIFLNQDSKHMLQFKPEQLDAILNSLHYFETDVVRKDKSIVCDSEVCQYALTLVDLFPHKSKAEKNSEKIKLLKRLFIGTSDIINGEKLTLAMKAEICRGKGIYWAQTVSDLLEDVSLTEEQRTEVAVCGLILNRYMAELGEGHPNFYAPQIYMGFDALKDSPLLVLPFPQTIKEELVAFCETSVARVQSLLAPRNLAQLTVAEPSLAKPEERSEIGLVEAHIQNAEYDQAIQLIMKNVDIELKLDRKTDRAALCVKLGLRWAQAITVLLKNPDLTVAQREVVGVCGFVWNEYMLAKDVRDPQYYTPQHYVSFDDIRRHKLLSQRGFKDLKSNLDKACKGSGLLSKGNPITLTQARLVSKKATNALVGNLSGLGLGDDDVEAGYDESAAAAPVATVESTGTGANSNNDAAPPPPPPAEESSEGDVSLDAVDATDATMSMEVEKAILAARLGASMSAVTQIPAEAAAVAVTATQDDVARKSPGLRSSSGESDSK